MKKLILAFLVVLVASVASAQTVTCSVTGASAKQASQYSVFLAAINADRAAKGLAPYANFNAHCGDVMLSAFAGWVAQINANDAAKVGAQAIAHGDETAPNGHCAAASLANGCTKAQVACFVLTGNTACN